MPRSGSRSPRTTVLGVELYEPRTSPALIWTGWDALDPTPGVMAPDPTDPVVFTPAPDPTTPVDQAASDPGPVKSATPSSGSPKDTSSLPLAHSVDYDQAALGFTGLARHSAKDVNSSGDNSGSGVVGPRGQA